MPGRLFKITRESEERGEGRGGKRMLSPRRCVSQVSSNLGTVLSFR
jgi:hypothetical protein